MNTPTQQSSDALSIIRTLAAGKPVEVTLACGNPYRFEPRDLLHNQEAVLLLAGIEQMLALHAGIAECDVGNVELSASLGVPSVRVPSFAEILDAAKGRIPHRLSVTLYDLKSLRNTVLHGSAPLFVRDSVRFVRRVYAEVRRFTGQSPDAMLQAAIKRAQAALQKTDCAPDAVSYSFLSDLLEMVDVERSLRNHLIDQGINVTPKQAVECAYELVRRTPAHHLYAGFVGDLRKLLILRNLMTHGVIFTLSPAHKALIRDTSKALHGAIAANDFARSGGRTALGDGFTNTALALGLAAMTLR